MTYILVGLLSSALMLLYRNPPAKTSPLQHLDLPSRTLDRRREQRIPRLVSYFGLFSSFSVLLIVAASRFGVGTDYLERHIPQFERFQLGYNGDYESGFALLNLAVGNFTSDPQWLIAVMSFLTLALVYRFVVRMSLAPALSIFVFVFGGFYLEAFNLAQQWLAIAILLNTIEYVLRKKPIPLILLTLLASLIHSSALIWFLAWPLMFLRLHRLVRVILIGGAVLAVVLSPQSLLTAIEVVAPDYAWYLGSDYNSVRSINLFAILTPLALFAASAILIRGNVQRQRYVGTAFMLQGINVVLLIATVTVAYLFSRVAYYFAPIQILALPLLLSLLRTRTARIFVGLGFMVLYAVGFYVQFIVWNAHGVTPYESVLF